MAFALVALGLLLVQQASAAGSRLSIAATQLVFADHEPVIVNVTLTGPGQIRAWDWPSTDSYLDQFVVQYINNSTIEQVPYLGRLGKRAAGEAAFLPLSSSSSSSSVVVQVDVSSSLYDFSRTGDYTVQFRATTKSQQQVELVEWSNTITFFVHGRAAQALVARRTVACSSSRQSTFKLARTASQQMSASAVKKVSSSASKYKLWFGTSSTGRKNTVRSTYTKVGKVLASGKLKIDCECANDRTMFAYVYPSLYKTTKTIYLCGAFWQAKRVGGSDTQAGTLIHEIAHFNDVAKAQDYVYGQTRCKSLARSSPTKAVKNADNLEYFAEL